MLSTFANKEEADRAYDVEVQQRGWALIKRLNFPDPADDGAVPPSSAATEAPRARVRGAVPGESNHPRAGAASRRRRRY